MNCRYDIDAKTYVLPDGEKCRTDEYGDPTHHCTARKTCSQHVGWGELTCARCIGRVRADLRRIVDLAALMLPEALVKGVNSEAASLAGPTADPEAWQWRQRARREDAYTRHWHDDAALMAALAALPEDDEHHPTLVLGRWVLAIAEDYSLDTPDPITLTRAADWLDRQLGKVAQDPEQDFPLLRREIGKCRAHLEAVLGDSQAPERGVPCPDCAADDKFSRLVRLYGHWCDSPDCERIHVTDESQDVWRCPNNRAHEWDPETYRRYLMERRGA